MYVQTLPDITGDNGVHALTTDATLKARWILFTAQLTSGTTAAVVCSKDATADATDGAHLSGNVPVLYPPNPTDPNDFYQLSEMHAYIPTGTTLTTTFGT